jgi:hypothetical protein
MLPGFRFLFAAVVLSMSILVFGFGAAALLRTAHEEFANTPSWQPAPETRFALTPPPPQPATQPVLAMLRVDDPPKDAPKQAANTDQPAPNGTVTTGATDQPAVAVEPASQPDKIAALQPADSTAPETAKPEAPTSEAPVTDSAPQAEAAPAPADAPAPPDDATKLAATEPAPAPMSEAAPTPPAEAVAAAPEQPNAPSEVQANTISTRIATLGGPPVTIAPPAAKAASAKSDTSAVKKRQRARSELRRRRNAERARLAKQTQQTLDAFGQPTTTAR